MPLHPLDLGLRGLPGAVSSYVLTDPEPLLVDPGPSTTLEALRAGLAEHGLDLADLRRVLLTHVHLDHAGVTGHLTAANPDLVVHVHADGAPHLVDPARLVASTRRTFGDAHDELWGEVLAVDAERIRAWTPGASDPLPGVEAHHTPGHIGHHLAYLLLDSGTLMAGDSLGIILAADAPTHPPTPPPSLDLRAWKETLERLAELDAERVAVGHFGVHADFHSRRRELARRLRELEDRVKRAAGENGHGDPARRYEREVRETLARHLPAERVDGYFEIFSVATDWRGVEFYLERTADA